MPRIDWDDLPPTYDYGLDRGVLYSDVAVPWNGLTQILEADSTEIDTEYYFDGVRVATRQILGDFSAKLTAFTYPEVFSEYNGYSEDRSRNRFGLSYRTLTENGYETHILYDVTVSDGSRSWSTLSQSVDPSLFTWDIQANAVEMPYARPSAKLSLRFSDEEDASWIKDILYGTEDSDPRLPTPFEIVEMYELRTSLRITYNGDGTYTATGSDDVVTPLSGGRFELNAPTVFLSQSGIFVASSH